MRLVKCTGLGAVAVFLGLATAAPAKDGKDDALLGDWEIVGMVYKGEAQNFDEPIAGTVKIEPGKLWLRYPSFVFGPAEHLITLRPSASPREMDMRLPARDHVWRGIYE